MPRRLQKPRVPTVASGLRAPVGRPSVASNASSSSRPGCEHCALRLAQPPGSVTTVSTAAAAALVEVEQQARFIAIARRPRPSRPPMLSGSQGPARRNRGEANRGVQQFLSPERAQSSDCTAIGRERSRTMRRIANGISKPSRQIGMNSAHTRCRRRVADALDASLRNRFHGRRADRATCFAAASWTARRSPSFWSNSPPPRRKLERGRGTYRGIRRSAGALPWKPRKIEQLGNSV